MSDVGTLPSPFAPAQGRARLVVALSALNQGGAERVVINLLRHLDRELFEITLLVERAGPLLPLVPGDIPIRRLSFPTGMPEVLTGVASAVKAIRSLRPDFILSNNVTMDFYMCMGKALSRVRTKLGIVVHADYGHWSGADQNRVMSIKVLTPLIPYTYRLADKIISVSEGVRASAGRLVRVSADRHTVIPNPVWDELTRIQASEPPPEASSRFPAGRKTILSVGRIVAGKDQETLIRSLHLLHEQFNNRACLIIVGGGNNTELARLAEDLKLTEHIHFAGDVFNPYPFYSLADVFALSSRTEGFGNVLVESMAMGCPVVSTDCPSGPAEILDHGRFGCLVPVGNPLALAGAIHRVLSNDDERQRMIKLGTQRAEDYRSDRITRRYERLILETIRDPRSRLIQ